MKRPYGLIAAFITVFLREYQRLFARSHKNPQGLKILFRPVDKDIERNVKQKEFQTVFYLSDLPHEFMRNPMSYLKYELNLCPFCGADVKQGNKNWLYSDQSHDFSISCLCGANGPKKSSKEKAMMAWNQRETLALDALWEPFDLQEESSGFKGKLKSIDFGSILQFLSTLSKSGILQVFKGNKRSAICLKDGQVIATSSNFGRQLGEIIFDNDQITLEQLHQALEKSKSTGKHLGETILDLGHIDPATLKGFIREQVKETLRELMHWEEGTFQYRDYIIEFDKRGVEAINTVGMLLDVSRISDEITATGSIRAVNQ